MNKKPAPVSHARREPRRRGRQPHPRSRMRPVMLNASIGVRGLYKLIVRKAADPNVIVSETGWNKNLITNAGLDALQGLVASYSTSVFVHGMVGTGNTAPAVTDTALATFKAGFSYAQAVDYARNYTVLPYYVRWRRTFRYDAGVATGNIAEVGVHFSTSSATAITSGTQVHSRALIVDGGGSPTTVAVAADELLDVVWDFYWYIPASLTGSVNLTIDGVVTATNYEVRPLDLDQWLSGTFVLGGPPSSKGYWTQPVLLPLTGVATYHQASAGALTTVTGANITGTLFNHTSRSTAAYVNGTYYRDHTFVWHLNEGNVGGGGISALQFSFHHGGWQMSLSPSIPKVNTKIFTIVLRLSITNV